MPGTPPTINREAEAKAAAVPKRLLTKPKLTKINASAAVANTSKKPSTHKCTTHQRQYSITDRLVRSP